MKPHQIQIDEQGRLKHFISIEGLSRDLLIAILDAAQSFAGVGERAIKKLPLLRGKTIATLFFEPSTRTRTTFELAAKRLSADVLDINVQSSATRKGESLLDTLRTLDGDALRYVRRAPPDERRGATHRLACSPPRPGD